MNQNEIGVYVHFPYCERKCPYCDFNSHVTTSIEHQRFLDAYKKDFDYFFNKLKEIPKLISIFFGGGTPSLMQPFVTNEIIDYICQQFKTNKSKIEITLEANPSSFEVKKFKDFKESGINRISIGVQSFVEEDLKKLGRLHNSPQAKNAITKAREIFDRFSFDLIYARENQKIPQWKEELEFALEQFNPQHISLYSLTIEKGTEFFKLHQDGKLTIPQNQEDFYETTNEICSKHGLGRYEVSNYAKNGNECIHNISYWTGKQYIGIGPGAHGRIEINEGRVATMNVNSPEKYLKSIETIGNAVQTFEILDEEKIAWELISTGLRTIYGFQLNAITHKFIDTQKVQTLANEGLLIRSTTHIVPTEKGLSLCDGITKFIFDN